MCIPMALLRVAEDYENSLSDGYGDTGDGSNESKTVLPAIADWGKLWRRGSYQTAEQWSRLKNAYNTGKDKVYQQAYEQAFKPIVTATATTSVSDQE